MITTLYIITTDIISICIAVISLLLSGFVFYKSSKTDKVNQVVIACNLIYEETFKLRGKISEKLGQSFYFDLETMISNEAIKIQILDYLTLMENNLYKIKQTCNGEDMFCKLTSLNLYLRMLALYPFILYARKENKDETKFHCYVDVLYKMKTLKKIKNYLENRDKICWIGIRNSDIMFSKNVISSSLTFFGGENSYFQEIRGNQNQNNTGVAPYFKDKTNEIRKKYENIKFMFYNSYNAYKGGYNLDEIIAVNDKILLEQLNDKIHMKWIFKEIIPLVPCETILGIDFDFNVFSEKFSTQKIILQSNHGGGGEGTFLITPSNIEEIKTKIHKNDKYIVSPYLEHSISVNVHIIIAEKQVVVSPASIQIIELVKHQLVYRGADFIAFRGLAKETQELIRKYCLKISDKLRTLGYKGVAGIDLMIDSNNQIYFNEVNPRFQASSILIDRFLAEKSKNEKKPFEATSLIDMQITSFKRYLVSTLNFYDEINASCYYYYYDEPYSKEWIEYKKNVLRDRLGKDFLNDGFSSTCKLESNGYMFRAIFPHKITEISPEHNLWISDNIKIGSTDIQNQMKLKIALMNQGISKYASDVSEDWKSAVYSSIDIHLLNQDIYVNCPISINFAEYSPFHIKLEVDEKYNLYYYNIFVSSINIENDTIKDFQLTSGEKLKNIIYYSTDRMRIKLNNGCDFKNNGVGCRFCDMPICSKKYSIDELKEAYDLSDKSRYTHILIGGGTSLSENSWDTIVEVAKYIKSKAKINISLMSIPPQKDMLPILKEAGIDEVCFNMEIYDEALSIALMPGKTKFRRKEYLDILTESTKIWTEKNAVRTAFVIGFEHKDSIIAGVKMLLNKGIQPVFSVFRPLPKSELNNHLAPTNEYLYEIFLTCEKECEKHNNELGPKCKLCRNNTLAL